MRKLDHVTLKNFLFTAAIASLASHFSLLVSLHTSSPSLASPISSSYFSSLVTYEI